MATLRAPGAAAHLTTECALCAHHNPRDARFCCACGSALGEGLAPGAARRGLPRNADLVFDMRYLRNPHWDPKLKPGTGLDADVAAYVIADPAYEDSVSQIERLILTLLPRYRAEGKSYVTIAFGCTGGRHRSVHVAARVAQTLRESGYEPALTHRNLDSAPQDGLEGRPPPASPVTGGNI